MKSSHLISETRQLTIKNKIISFEDVLKLSTLAYDEFLKGKNTDQDCYSEFSVFAVCSDNSSFESQDISLFQANSPLRNKRVTRIAISASGIKPARWRLEIEIRQRKWADNYVLIRSHDGIWVNGFLSKFNDLISSFTPQNTFVANHEVLLRVLASLGLGCIIGPVIIEFTKFIANPDPNYIPSKFDLMARKFPIVGYSVINLMCSVIGIAPAFLLIDKLKDLWPSVELAIGPEHTQIEKKRRNWIIGFFLLVVLPLILNFVYDLFKVFH